MEMFEGDFFRQAGRQAGCKLNAAAEVVFPAVQMGIPWVSFLLFLNTSRKETHACIHACKALDVQTFVEVLKKETIFCFWMCRWVETNSLE